MTLPELIAAIKTANEALKAGEGIDIFYYLHFSVPEEEQAITILKEALK